MPGLSGLLRPEPLTSDDGALPTVMVGKIHDTDPLRVTVPAIDGGRNAKRAFGTWPTAAAGDPVRLALDEFGGLTVIAWEPA